MLTHPNELFYNTKFRPLGVISAPRDWSLKFLHTADIVQALLAHTTNRVEDPPKILTATFKIGLKIPHMIA